MMNKPCFMFHAKLAPLGKIFDAAIQDMNALESEGWVDNKGKIDGTYPTYDAVKLDTEKLPGRDDMADDDQDPDIDESNDSSDQSTGNAGGGDGSTIDNVDDLLAVFHANPTRLTIPELIRLAKAKNVAVKKNWKEATMISKIQKGLNGVNN